ncbi:MAG TPA: L-seryl-tRNA(Sec) selenium transferase [Hyphomicrobiaceae bacterium]|nr:L-seryl-tRNA(Sec) selenium transferase [Hyphomicrobiaceae bacterium]
MTETQPVSRSKLPSVDQVLRTATGKLAVARFGHGATVGAIRKAVAVARVSARSGDGAAADAAAMAAYAFELLEEADAPSLKRVFNLTGTVLHTNLGRAVLPESAIAAAIDAMRSAVALEFDVGGAARGERDDHVRGLVRELTGAEDAAVVNNNAGAVLLALNTFGSGKDAIVSRGELIEIGGSFRLPDIMLRAGARLVEVGTTNRTHFRDYEQAIAGSTGLILKAHTSNYLIQGFTKSVPAPQLAALARAHNLPFVHDLGSGALVDLARYGLKREPTVREALAEGADLVTFSGDKLLGGPQAGIIAGSKELVARVAKNPMKRALRVDKIRLAALEAVLKLYRDPDRLPQLLPTLRYFERSRADIAAVAARLRDRVADAAGEGYRVSVTECTSQIGSGALPLETLPSAGLAIEPLARKGVGTQLDALGAALRSLPVPVIGRVHDGALILDLRCLDDEEGFAAQLAQLPARLNASGVRHDRA